LFGKLYLTNYGLAHLTKRSLGNLTNRKLQGVTLQKLACQTGPSLYCNYYQANLSFPRQLRLFMPSCFLIFWHFQSTFWGGARLVGNARKYLQRRVVFGFMANRQPPVPVKSFLYHRIYIAPIIYTCVSPNNRRRNISFLPLQKKTTLYSSSTDRRPRPQMCSPESDSMMIILLLWYIPPQQSWSYPRALLRKAEALSPPAGFGLFSCFTMSWWIVQQ